MLPYELSEEEKYNAKRDMVKRLSTYLVVTLCIYLSISAVINSSVPLNTVGLLFVLWITGLLIFISRKGITNLAYKWASDKESVNIAELKEPTEESVRYNLTPPVQELSNMDDEYMMPLSDSERKTFEELSKKLNL